MILVRFRLFQLRLHRNQCAVNKSDSICGELVLTVQLSFDKHFYGRIKVLNHSCLISPCIPSVIMEPPYHLNGHLSLYTLQQFH
jgi:hypothetical protein